MAFQRQADRLVIGHHLLRARHGGQLGVRLLGQLGRVRRGEQRQHALRHSPRLPQRIAPAQPDRAAGIGIGQQPQARATASPARCASCSTWVKPVPRAATSASAHSSRKPSIWRKPSRSASAPSSRRSKQIVPTAGVDIDPAHLDPMLARIADQLRGRVEAHRLGIQQRAGEHRRMMAFEPGRDIDQLGEALGMAFGKAVAAEALDLVVAAFREIALIAAPHHPLDHLRLILVDRAEVAEGRHRPPEPIGLVGVKPAATMAIFIACSWNSGTPKVRPSTS